MPQRPIAIIGVSAEFPSGKAVNLDFSSFWPFLLQKDEAYSPIPPYMFNYDTFSYLITPRSGAFLSQPTLFDPFEFGISATEAQLLPVSTRKLLEHAFLALRDAGINYRGADVGVYTSGVVHDPTMFSNTDPHTIGDSLATFPSAIANRISYHLDLRGPSLPLDTACSSTLIATHLAVQALGNGECESAVVGGAQLDLRLHEWIQDSKLGVLSKDGKCKPFDASADGFSRGEGVACIVLKPLDAALRDGDHVYATILGSAINSAGNQAPLNAPVAAAQQAAMLRAYERAGKNPDEVDFVEMHATGTATGDPTEANWVGEVFRHKDGSPLLAGSVKGNIGHLEITSFFASLLKVLHIIEHNTIPPTANFTTPNPKIKWEEYNLQVPNTAPVSFTPRASSQKALISLSSFGIGGANGHVVVEGQGYSTINGKYDSQHHRLFEHDDAILIMSGGLSPRSAFVMADLLKDAFSHTPKESLPFLARLASRQSRQLTWRSYALYHPYVEIPKAMVFCDAQLVPRTAPRLAFVFNGQGPQHRLMGHQLFAKYPAFRRSVYECDKAYQAVTSGSSLLKDYGFFSGPATSDSIHWTVLLPALTVFQVALFDLLCSFGVKPDIVVGHSAGETAVLYTSGAGSKEMAVQLSVARSQMMRPAETPEGGNMAAFACDEIKVRALIDEILTNEGIFDVSLREQGLAIACYNGPEGIVVTGLVDLIGKLCALAEKHGIVARRLRIFVPAHSPLMDICKENCTTLVDVFRRFPEASKPTVATYSTVTGEKWEEPYSTDYYWRNTRHPVLFNQVISKLAKQYPNMCYIEISPHPSLSSYVSSAAPSSDVICPSRRPTKTGEFLENTTFLESLGQLAMKGFNIDFDALNGLPAWEPNVKLPPYPFNKKDIPFHTNSPAFNQLLQPRKGPLNDPRLRLSTKTHPLLAGHVIHSKPILPASGFIEMALEFGARTLSNVEFLAALPLPSDVPATVEVGVDGAEWTVKTSSSVEFPTFDRLHARGLLTYEADETDSTPLDLASIKSRCSQLCRIESLYEHAFKGFAEYGTEFRRMKTCIQGEDELFAIFQGHGDLPESDEYVFNPVVLDSVFHGCMFLIMENEPVFLDYESRDYFLPSRVARVVLHEALMTSLLPDQIAAHFVLKDWTPERVSFNIYITNLAGERLCTLSLFEMTRHSNHVDRPVKRHYQTEWLPITLPAADCKDQYHVRELSNNTNDLRRTLDRLVAQTIAKTMKGQVVVDAEWRQHYREFAKKVIEQIDLYPAPDPSLVDSLMGQYPSYFEVTEHVSKVYADIFTSSTTTVKALHSNTETMQNFYGPDNIMQSSCREAARLFRDLLQQFSMTGKKVIRVLELGCGTTTGMTGMLTEHLVNVLPDFPNLVVEYFASDVSLNLALQTAERIQYPYMRAIAYDLTQSIGGQEIVPMSFDVVTACCVLHTTSNLTQTMGSISDLLVPGGYVLAIELDGAAWEHCAPGTLWYDFVFGDFEDRDDSVSHCMVPLQQWRKLLQSAELDCITFSSSHPDEDHTFVILGQKANGIRCILPDSEVFNDHRFIEEICESDLVFIYQYGHEMDLRDKVEKLNKSQRLSIWIMATAGLDGAGAHGLVQTLIREFILWTIGLVIFDISWSIPKRMAAISSLQKRSLRETEIKISTSGEIYIPRIVPFVASPSTVPFDSSLPWAQINGEIVHTTPSSCEENDINVHVLHWSSTNKDHPKAFLGTVVGDGQLEFPKGNWVMGITTGPLTNFLVTHAGSVVPSELGHICILADIPGIVTAALALNPDTLTRFGRLKTIGRVLVTDVHTTIGFAAARFCLTLGLNTFCIGEGDAGELSKRLHVPVDQVSVASNAIWIAQQRGGYDVIISGAQTKAASQTIKQLASPGGTVHMWNSPSQNLTSCLKHDRWSAILALEAALRILPKDFTSFSPSIPVDDIVSRAPASVLRQIQLFDATKVYALIGGVGGIGIRMVLWMYENGARNVILTSRRGRETLQRTEQIDSLRILRYLERLPDLRLQLEAVDAVSYEATKQLLGSLEKPFGGCFLMSMVLSDKMFLNQTKDSFDKVAAAKTKAFLNLERCINISELDFFVTFSSVAALFGNAGQSAYSTESAAVESMTSKYSNAFSLIVPGITDSGRLARDQRNGGFRADQLFEWALTTQELFDCLGDGLRTLRHGPFNQYIPELNWTLIQRDMGFLTTFEHLCVSEKVQIMQPADIGLDNKADLESLIRSALDIPIEEFSSNIPFTSYGLDSLIAARLSVAIRAATGVKVTQIQLLADMTLEELFRETSPTVTKTDE